MIVKLVGDDSPLPRSGWLLPVQQEIYECFPDQHFHHLHLLISSEPYQTLCPLQVMWLPLLWRHQQWQRHVWSLVRHAAWRGCPGGGWAELGFQCYLPAGQHVRFVAVVFSRLNCFSRTATFTYFSYFHSEMKQKVYLRMSPEMVSLLLRTEETSA